jgi:hypothetical protein
MIKFWAFIKTWWFRCFHRDPTGSIYARIMWTNTLRKVL